MPRFIVEVVEKHISAMLIEDAENEGDAVARVDQREGEELSSWFEERTETSEWACYPVDADNNEILTEESL